MGRGERRALPRVLVLESGSPAKPILFHAKQTGTSTEVWRVERDGDHVCHVRLTIHHGSRQGSYIVTGPDAPGVTAPFLQEGTLTFDVWDDAAVRDVLGAILHRVGAAGAAFSEAKKPSGKRSAP
jgi:hypothetical protein